MSAFKNFMPPACAQCVSTSPSGGSATLDELETLARRVHDLVGWHGELYIDARTIDEDLSRRIASLPAASIDHLGMHEDGLTNVLHFVE